MIYLRNIVSLCLSKHPRITHSELLDNLLRSVELGDCLAVFIVDDDDLAFDFLTIHVCTQQMFNVCFADSCNT